ncbi:MAG TPA: winged helix-turn-helix domain-containing protein [Pyrinomonadaceae bacterium]|nr:winged helix-turn-helix domain-containing protein [Pyrinomonadaceae bacterium]
MQTISEKCYEFGEFRFDAEEKVLWRGAALADVTPKALEILVVLVENAGRIVPKEEIYNRVWAGSFVEEANLTHHIFRLRKVLGESADRKFIETVPKRGYRFVAEVRQTAEQTPPSSFQNSNSINRAAPVVLQNKNLRVFSVIVLFALFGTAAFVWYKSSANVNRQQQHHQQQLLQETANPKSKIQNPMTVSRLTDYGKAVAATISPDGKFAAYAQNFSSGEGTLYIRQIETNTERKLLEPAERNFGSISFSPDGTFIYYIAYEPGEPEGALYRIPVVGGQAAKVLSNVKFMFTLSPDGRRVAFFRFDTGAKQTRIISAALEAIGDEKTVLTFNDAEKAVTGVPAFSPDGNLLAFGLADVTPATDFSQPQFSPFTVDLQTGEMKSLTTEKWSEIGKTAWMPDGSGLVFPGNRPRVGNQIYYLAFPSGEVTRITKELNVYGNYGMGISRDGTRLVADLRESEAQIWSIDAGGSTARAEQLTNGRSDGARGLASLSDNQIVYTTITGDDGDLWILRSGENGIREGRPLTSDAFFEGETCAARGDDGTDFLIFASDRVGGSHLFRVNADGTNLKQITFGENYDAAPDCSADGKFVVYASNASIWKISADGGEPTRLTDFECLAPSISPDAKFFACVQPTGVQIKNAALAVLAVEGGAPVKSFEVIPFGFYYRPARWTPDGSALVFKRTDKQIGNLWRQNLAGGEPKQISDFKSEVILNHVFSRDGKKLLVSRGKFAANTVLLKNFLPD